MGRSDIHFPPKHEALRDDVHELGALVGDMRANFDRRVSYETS